MKKLTLLASVGAIALLAGPAPVQAETVTIKTEVEQKELPNTYKVNLWGFDTNKDGRLSRVEVGDKIFMMFDRDGNHVIDNIEYVKPTFVTIVPMEKTQTVSVDLDENDHRVDYVDVTEEEFYRQSALARFDNNDNGMSAKEFIQAYFNKLDFDNSKVIELAEWRIGYKNLLSNGNLTVQYNN